MKEQLLLEVRDSATIDAPVSIVYDLIADYVAGHPRIVPPRYFGDMRIVRGGYGAGTEITFEMYPFGLRARPEKARAVITEPDPGHILVESDLERGVVTTFTVEGVGASGAWVELKTHFSVRAGFLGRVERWVVGKFLRKVYRAELAQLARVARQAVTRGRGGKAVLTPEPLRAA